ncbi:type II toxin-antitoxin system prevent-host-death family antitoxin [Demequina sp.]|uniref:type II toxin-antitoxin system prevent-host-death family antitoxin n=1 Tax=Demequina sp. TaxID=2050685 RepID=UPI003D0FDEAE
MEVTFTEFKASLASHVGSVKDGTDVIITQKGAPVARLTSVEGSDLISSLIQDGLITPPAEDRAVPRLPQAEAAKDALSSLLGRLRR